MFTPNNILMFMRMSVDIKFLSFLKRIYKLYKKNDKSFTFRNYIRLLFYLIRDETIRKHEDKYLTNPWFPPIPSESMIKMIESVQDKDKMFLQQIHGIRKAPTMMSVCLTRKCVNKCDFCSARERSSGEELTTDEWKKIFDELNEMGVSVISITGGEPLLRKDLLELIEYINDDITINLRTSGHKLDVNMASALKDAGLFSVEVGMDLFTPGSNSIKNKKDFNRSLMAIYSSNQAGLYVNAQLVIGKEYIDEKKLFPLFKFLRNYGADEIKILEPIPMGSLYYSKNNLDDILYNNEDRERLIEIQKKANRRLFMPKISFYSCHESKDNMGCGAGIQISYISETGELMPCDFLPISFGNVKNEKLSDLFLNMTNKIGKPKLFRSCREFNYSIYKNKNCILPYSEADGLESIEKLNSNMNEYPGLYKRLQKTTFNKYKNKRA